MGQTVRSGSFVEAVVRAKVRARQYNDEVATIAPAANRLEADRSRALAERYAWGVVGWNVLVIVWGALVRASGSGAGCGNHWPLCNGEVVPLAPRMDTIIEFTHRCMTGGAAFAVLGLLLITFRVTRPHGLVRKDEPKPRWAVARWAAVISGVLLLNEAFLGALLVKLGYVTTNRSVGRVILLSVHLSNTLLLLAALVVTAVALHWPTLRPTWAARRGELLMLLGGLCATIVVGVSGSLAALGDTLFPSATLAQAFAQDLSHSAPMLLRVRWVHPASAVLAAIYLVWVARRARAGGWGKMASVLLGLLGLQFALGVLDVLLLAPVWLQLVHLAGADAFWIVLVALSTMLCLGARPSDERLDATAGLAR